MKVNKGTGIFLAISLIAFISCKQDYKKQAEVDISQRVEQLLNQLTLKEKVSLLAGKNAIELPAIKRLGIPSLRMKDGPHGVTDGEATCFPSGINMGSSWNPELVQKVGAAIGRETKAKGYHIILGPCANIHRQPLGGRNFESFSEDPFLSSRMTVSYVNGVQSEKTGVCVKHYAANNQEKDRHSISSEVDERTLREIYLPSFEAAAKEADAWTIMSAYNKLNGIYCTESNWLLKDVLKGEWGYKGVVISDWTAIHDIAAVESGNDLEMPGPGHTGKDLLAAIKSGKISEQTIDKNLKRILRVMILVGLMDEKQPQGEVNTKRHQQIAYELAAESAVLLKNDQNVLPFDKNKIKKIAVIGPNAKEVRMGGLGSSKVTPPYFHSLYDILVEKYGNEIEILYDQGCQFTDMPSIDSIYFRPEGGKVGQYGLKGIYYNNRKLEGEPIMTRIDSAVDFDWPIGTPGGNVPAGGYSIKWTGKLIPPKTGKYKLGLTNNDNARVFINGELIIDNWEDLRLIDPKVEEYEFIADKAYDIQVDFNQWGATAGVRLSWEIPGEDKIGDSFDHAIEIAKEADAVILVGGFSEYSEGEGADRKSMKLSGLQDDLITTITKANSNLAVVLINGSNVAMPWINQTNAVVEAYYPNQEGSRAITDILFGTINPSGKLPESFPNKLEDNPAFNNYPGVNGKVHYKEGIFVGYRYYDSYDVDVLFPFGHGLSYTDFEYNNISISNNLDNDNEVKVEFEIKNIGTISGKEIAQIYVVDKESTIPRPKKELKGFRKISLSQGESKKIEILLDRRAFSYYDVDKKKWLVEPGEFEILVGSSSKDIRLRKVLTI